MTDERLKVLEILQEGKIGAKDAARLLEALNKTPQDDGDVKVKVKVKKNGDDLEAEIDEDIEAEIEEGVEAQVNDDVKMKIKVKMNQNEDV